MAPRATDCFRCSYLHLPVVTLLFSPISRMDEVMDIEELNYSPDPFPDQVIFKNPNPNLLVSAPACSVPVVTLPGHNASSLLLSYLSIESSALDCPPLSPDTLHLLTVISPPSPSFEPNPPVGHLHTWTSSSLLTQPVKTPSSVGHNLPHSENSPSGCFETLAIKVKSVTQLQQEGIASSDPLLDHPSTPHTRKPKTKCVKVTTKDLTICFGEGIAMGEDAAKFGSILVGHVCGREYTAERLTL